MALKATTDTFTAQQLKAIELLAGGGLTLTEIQKAVPVAMDTLWRWRKDTAFIDAILNRSREMLREAMPAIYQTLAKKARKGDARHLRILIDHLEHLESHGEQYKGGSITVVWKDKWEEDDSISPPNDD